MSIAERSGEPLPAEQTPTTPQQARRPLRKRVMHAVRRTHLYFGLLLLPWAVLYGITGFLFNHPSAFADAPTATFGRSELAGTPMESLPVPREVAGQVVAALNARAKDGKPYTLVEPEKARYTREFAFTTVKADGTDVSLLFDVNNPGGTVRSRPAAPPAKPPEPAPFAITPRTRTSVSAPIEALILPEPLHQRVKAAVPVVLERTGFPNGPVTVTSVPDLSFRMSDGAKVWTVIYNALTGSVSGAPSDDIPPPEQLSTRRFLTRLHLAAGFPGRTNAKWFWAVLVDATAFVMVFWGLSGLFMWRQVKSTRRWGLLVLLVSAVAATALGLGMHDVLTPR
jgi:hypothetical protein